MNRNLVAAQEYARLGWCVFPVHAYQGKGCSCGSPKCGSPGKHPITGHGFQDATLDPEQIQRWWTEYPWANVAIPTGKVSGLVVLDIDPRNGGDESLKCLLNGNDIPATVTAETGGGGQHYLFRYPSTGELPRKKLGPGVDFLSDGAYFIVPFSRHKSGRYYGWRRGLDPQKLKPAPLPAWVIDTSLERVEETPDREYNEPCYIEGSRNATLFADGCAMRRRGFEQEAIEAALLEQNEAKCSPPLDEGEVHRIAISAGRYEPEVSEFGPGESGEDLIKDEVNPFYASILSFDGILDPDIGKVDYVVDQLLPRENLTIIAAEWKTGKTIIMYRLLLDLIFGEPVFGTLDVAHPYKVGLFQLEMPGSEDLRRFRKLVLGAGRSLEEVRQMQREGLIYDFNMPMVSLRERKGRLWFHRAILDLGIEVVMVDSLLAGFSPADLNENPVVRDLLHQTFTPLLKEGVTCTGIHHFRKPQATDKLVGDRKKVQKAAVLGGIQFGAAAGRTYGLERLPKAPHEQGVSPLDFNCRLSSLGSWTPTESEYIIAVEENEAETETSVRILEEGDQLKGGGATAVQQAAVALSAFVKEHRRVGRKDAIDHVVNGGSASRRTVERGESYAKAHDWIDVVDAEGRGHKKDLVPGLLN